MLKLTAQAAWMTMVARLAIEAYVSGERPRVGSPSLAGMQTTF